MNVYTGEAGRQVEQQLRRVCYLHWNTKQSKNTARLQRFLLLCNVFGIVCAPCKLHDRFTSCAPVVQQYEGGVTYRSTQPLILYIHIDYSAVVRRRPTDLPSTEQRGKLSSLLESETEKVDLVFKRPLLPLPLLQQYINIICLPLSLFISAILLSLFGFPMPLSHCLKPHFQDHVRVKDFELLDSCWRASFAY